MFRRLAAVVLFALLSIAAAPRGATAAAEGTLCNTPAATGCAGATSLPVFNPTHYALMPGVTITSKIIGATDLVGNETCSSGPAGVDVIIKSSQFGNETVCGSLSSCPGAGCTITFTYTAPNGPNVCACQTSIVAYGSNGNNANNDIVNDGVHDGTPDSAAGFAFLDSQGQPIDTCGCATTTTTSTTTSTTSTTTTTTTTTTTSTTTTSTTTSTTTTTTTTTTTSTTTSTTTTTTSSTTTTTTPIEILSLHYDCYQMRGANLPTPKPVVMLQDVFGTYKATLDRGHRLCAPTNKNGEDPDAPQRPEHLTGYDFVNVTPNILEPNDVHVANQFGTYTVDVRNPVRLLVPTAKSLVAPPPPAGQIPTNIRHFLCHDLSGVSGPRPTGITVQSQFAANVVAVTDLGQAMLCAPVNKNGGDPDAVNDPNFLVCFNTSEQVGFGTLNVFLNNQFGPSTTQFKNQPFITQYYELCVPPILP